MHDIGVAGSGMVSLVKEKQSGTKLALKTISLRYLSKEDQKSAECEVEFLRVISGPTILRFHESFVENQTICILLEHADGGSLADLIRKHRVTGGKFTTDQILMYAAQMTLALLALHSKQILHRGVTAQNLFIKQGVLKLSEFGLAKALASDADMA